MEECGTDGIPKTEDSTPLEGEVIGEVSNVEAFEAAVRRQQFDSGEFH